MAGVDHEIEGEAVHMAGLKIGYLPQEPELNAEHTVRETAEEGLGDLFSSRKRLEDIYAEYAEPDDDFDHLATQPADLAAAFHPPASPAADTTPHPKAQPTDPL